MISAHYLRMNAVCVCVLRFNRKTTTSVAVSALTVSCVFTWCLGSSPVPVSLQIGVTTNEADRSVFLSLTLKRPFTPFENKLEQEEKEEEDRGAD